MQLYALVACQVVVTDTRVAHRGIVGACQRFQRLVAERKILSLSFFRDEEAIHAWRTLENHRTAQCAGRASVFANYRLRMAGVIRDSGMVDREEAPVDSRAGP